MADIKGSCRCGQVSYASTADPVFVGLCHCRACQKSTGSAYAAVLAVPTASLAVTGTTKRFDDTGDTGSATALPPSQGIIVQFALLSAPPSIDPAAPAVFIGDPSSGKAMNLDTSDASGNANHRQLVVVPARLASVTGSATVNVTASYAGTLLSGSNLHFVIPIKASITATSNVIKPSLNYYGVIQATSAATTSGGVALTVIDTPTIGSTAMT